VNGKDGICYLYSLIRPRKKLMFKQETIRYRTKAFEAFFKKVSDI